MPSVADTVALELVTAADLVANCIREISRSGILDAASPFCAD
jgi:hypothetical protein